jgi:amidase
MASQDPADPATRIEGWKIFDVDAALAPNALSGARLGVVRTWSGANEGVDAVFENALETLADQGAELVEVELPDPLGNLWSVIGPVLDADFEPEIEAYLATLSEGYPRTLEALIAAAESPALVNSEHPVNPGRIGGFRDALAAGGYDSPARKKGLEKLQEVRAMVRELFADNDVDAFVFPTMACPASVRFDAEDPTYVCDIDDPYRPTYVGSATGFPDVSVPAGLTTTDTMPVGLSFLGLPFTEARLIGLAAHFESALAAPTQPPPTTPHLDR